MNYRKKFVPYVIVLLNGEKNGSNAGNRLSIVQKDVKEQKKINQIQSKFSFLIANTPPRQFFLLCKDF